MNSPPLPELSHELMRRILLESAEPSCFLLNRNWRDDMSRDALWILKVAKTRMSLPRLAAWSIDSVPEETSIELTKVYLDSCSPLKYPIFPSYYESMPHVEWTELFAYACKNGKPRHALEIWNRVDTRYWPHLKWLWSNVSSLAIINGHLDTVKMIEAKKRELYRTSVTDNMSMFLVEACERGRLRVAEYLLELERNNNQGRNRKHKRAIEAAAHNGHVEVVLSLLDAGFVPRPDVLGSLQHEDVFALLVGRCFPNPNLLTLLYQASHAGSVCAIRYVLSKGVRKRGVRNALRIAISAAQAAAVSLLLEHVPKTAGFKGWLGGQLDVACRHSSGEIAQILVTNGGIDVNRCNGSGLWHACVYSTPSTVSQLLQLGADATLGQGRSLVDAVKRRGWSESGFDIIELLLTAGADPNTQNGLPIIEAASQGLYTVCELLLQYKADVHMQDGKALSAAVDGMHWETQTVLKSFGAKRRCVAQALS